MNFIYTNFSRVRLDFIYSNAGWALFHANRSLFRIIWWNWIVMYNNYKIYYQYPPNPRTHRTQEPTEPKNHRTQEPPNSEIICSRFCYSSVGIWPLSNILRSRSVIAQWVYEQFSNILRNHLKRQRPTAMIELSQRKQEEIGLENDGRGVPTYASDVFLCLSKIKCLEIEKPSNLQTSATTGWSHQSSQTETPRSCDHPVAITGRISKIECVMHTVDTTSNHHWSDFTRSLKNKIGNSENISWYTLSRWRLVA